MLRARRTRRVLLFMPGDDLHKIKKGAASGADSIIMDLEDGVALNHKEAARETVRQALRDESIEFGRTERLVRLNPPGTGLQESDIAVTIEGYPDGYVIPKVESSDDIQTLSDTLRRHERRIGLEPNTTRLIPIIETALGVVNLPGIARADQRVEALAFGAEDLAGSIGAVRTPEGDEVFYARSAVVLHAAAFGLQALDTPYVDLHDLDGLRAESERVMRLGYTGKLAIHPAQIDVIKSVFTPTEQEVAEAHALITAFENHQQNGTGVFAYNGKMVDMPMIRAARRILARAISPDDID
ncbi:MAG: CoA ester lyase [Chloroflexi bacterium]|nr:CoA ester lyase [Chloroflexota bacterium]